MTCQCTPELVTESPKLDSFVSLTGTSTQSDLQRDPPPPDPSPAQTQPRPTADTQGDKAAGQSQTRWSCCGTKEDRCGTEEDRCGACRHLLLALVLVVFSPLIAVGVCVADIVTGECCKGCDEDSEDTEKDY